MNVLQQLQAGIRVEFNEQGRFLRILSSEQQDKITVQFYRNGAMICEALQVGRGFSETMEDGNFDSYAVTSSVTQNVNIVTRAGSRILYDTPPVGDVNVLNWPANQNVTLSNNFDRYGASFNSMATPGANVAETIFTAAANVNGAVVWACTFMVQTVVADSPNRSVLIAKATTPANAGDGDVLVSSKVDSVYTASNYHWMSGQLMRPIFIPAGKGLFFIHTLAVSTGQRSALYTLL